MHTDFEIFGACIGRVWMPLWKRVLLDLVCRLTGHLLWRVQNNAGFKRDGDTLTHYTSHCRRCWQWGYVQGDYRPAIHASRVVVTDVNGVEIVGP